MEEAILPKRDTRADRLNQAYEYLRSEGQVHTKKELATKIGVSYTNVSSAMKGDSRYLTNNFLSKFNNAFGDIFLFDWLNAGWGPMIDSNKKAESNKKVESEINAQSVTMPREVFDQITRLTETVLSQQRTIERLADLQKGVVEGVRGVAPKEALG